MHTSLLARVAAPDDDAAILAALTAVPLSTETSSDTYTLGLRNADGEIYRRVEINGMVTTIRITEALRALGFQPEPGSLSPPPHGCQIVLHRAQEVLPFGFAPRRKAFWRPVHLEAAQETAATAAAV